MVRLKCFEYIFLTCPWNSLTAADPRGLSLTSGRLYCTAPLWITFTSVNWSTPTGRLLLAIPVCLPSGTYPLNCFPKRGIADSGLIALFCNLRRKYSSTSIVLTIPECLATRWICKLIASWYNVHPAPGKVTFTRFSANASHSVSLTATPLLAFCLIVWPTNPTKHVCPTPKYVCATTVNCLAFSELCFFGHDVTHVLLIMFACIHAFMPKSAWSLLLISLSISTLLVSSSVAVNVACDVCTSNTAPSAHALSSAVLPLVGSTAHLTNWVCGDCLGGPA